ncbi:Uncharacterized conserved secreted protein [Synechococcus sp. RCC307]|nr:Uncharacterized conserved secreted protein [Synechococcus sp. RCC307]
MRRLLSAAASASLLLAQAPVLAEGSADDIGVMNVSLKDSIKPRFGFQGQTQGAGTPNEAGIGGFFPLSVSENGVFFVDALANANFSDFSGTSSIVDTAVAGTTISTSTRLGYRWLNTNRSWMFGINGGYDSRPMNSGPTVSGIKVGRSTSPTNSATSATGTVSSQESSISARTTNSGSTSIKKNVDNHRSVFYQQVAANIEAVSNSWNFNAYALVPIGDTQQRLNSHYDSAALDKYGIDVGYFITPELNASVGYYYQTGDEPCTKAGGASPDGSGVLAKLGYELTEGLTLGAELSYDHAYETRVLGKLSHRFSAVKSSKTEKKEPSNIPVIKSLTQTPSNRNIGVYDPAACIQKGGQCDPKSPQCCKHGPSGEPLDCGLVLFSGYYCECSDCFL